MKVDDLGVPPICGNPHMNGKQELFKNLCDMCLMVSSLAYNPFSFCSKTSAPVSWDWDWFLDWTCANVHSARWQTASFVIGQVVVSSVLKVALLCCCDGWLDPSEFAYSRFWIETLHFRTMSDWFSLAWICLCISLCSRGGSGFWRTGLNAWIGLLSTYQKYWQPLECFLTTIQQKSCRICKKMQEGRLSILIERRCVEIEKTWLEEIQDPSKTTI